MYKNNIKKYRKSAGMNLEEVSSRAGISKGYLCHLENGTRVNPSAKVMEQIAKALEKTVSEIFFFRVIIKRNIVNKQWV